MLTSLTIPCPRPCAGTSESRHLFSSQPRGLIRFNIIQGLCFVAHDLTGEISLLISVSAATEEPGPERDGEHGQRLRLTGERPTTRTCVAGLKLSEWRFRSKESGAQEEEGKQQKEAGEKSKQAGSLPPDRLRRKTKKKKSFFPFQVNHRGAVLLARFHFVYLGGRM